MNIKEIKRLLKHAPINKLKLQLYGPDEFRFNGGFYELYDPKDDGIIFIVDCGTATKKEMEFFQKAPDIIRFLMKKLEKTKKK